LSGSADVCTDDVDESLNSTKLPVTQSRTSERDRACRPDRPTTLSRPLQLPTCCNFRRQPWRTYVHGEFSYTAAPRSYTGVDEELGAAADNDAVVRIIESLQANGKQLCCSSGYHGDDTNNPGAGNINGDHSIKELHDQAESNEPTSQNARKSSPEVAAVNITTVSLSSNVKETRGNNGMSEVDGLCADSDEKELAGCSASERSPTRQMRQDINQNLRPINGAKHYADVVPETISEYQTGTGNGRQRPKSPPTGRQQKSKPRRSRNRSLASRDERLANGGAEQHQNQHGGRKSTRSRTLSPALTERFDYHVSRPVQTNACRPEIARRDVTVIGYETSALCFRPGVHRQSRATTSEHAVTGVVACSPAQSRRSVRSAGETDTTILYFITKSIVTVNWWCNGIGCLTHN